MDKRPWTPGPWFALKYASGRGKDWGIGIPSGDGYIAVARVHRVAQRDTGREEANAALIAAAPDMAELLLDIIEAYDTGNIQMSSPEIGGDHQDNPPHPWHEEWLYGVRAALAKAGGAS